ncbi:MAG: DUF2809 domain-containing protein [Candidatus Zixiibacteriota bacterium]|nr:MAG: DUF2809 domain-containing protein [candidate division Zixibacteria bacterium]
MDGNRKARLLSACISLILLTPLGFYSKFYRGPAQVWVNNSLGGVFYVIFWCLVAFLFLPRAKPRTIALVALAATCALEALQLWRPPFLESLRSHFLGATILGTWSTWTDFPYYVVGALLGWGWLEGLQRRLPKRRK